MFIVAINALRTLGAHRWTHDGSREMTFVEQMLDSVNYPHNPLIGGLWAPIGLRFHALHHIFPTMPYHALATAHKRLMRELPADSPYRRTEARSLMERDFNAVGTGEGEPAARRLGPGSRRRQCRSRQLAALGRKSHVSRPPRLRDQLRRFQVVAEVSHAKAQSSQSRIA